MHRRNPADESDTKAILFDLDGTLLVNPMAEFVPAYLNLFCEFVRDLVSPEIFTSSLLEGVQAMESNRDPSSSNEEVFREVFFPRVGIPEDRLAPRLEAFYHDKYPELADLTRPVQGNRQVLEAALRRSLEIVIATNPLFPLTALEQRLAWAGLPVTEYDYSLVTSLELMHAAKPTPEYYLEILNHLSRSPDECLMVGDDWERDILPAMSIGIQVFWIEGEHFPKSDEVHYRLWLGQGSLEDLLGQLV